MTEIDEHGRPEPPLAGDEIATLLGFLDYQRATLAWKCSGLDPAGLRAELAPTSMTLGGLLSLRWILVHMIEEYARHNGHADLLRESVDGLVGE
ncbi:MAG: DUF664 domain-containing protein [Nitriliruptorales bacterium]